MKRFLIIFAPCIGTCKYKITRFELQKNNWLKWLKKKKLKTSRCDTILSYVQIC